jgi:hypothetical protein
MLGLERKRLFISTRRLPAMLSQHLSVTPRSPLHGDPL